MTIDLDSCVVDQEEGPETMRWCVRLLDSGVVSVSWVDRSVSITALQAGTPRLLFEVIDPKGHMDRHEITIEVLDPTSVAWRTLPYRFVLEPSHPNPFNTQTVIGFEIPSAGETEVAIFDIRGERVALPLRTWLNPGHHRVVFEGGDLPSGLYRCRPAFSGQTLIRKLVLQR